MISLKSALFCALINPHFTLHKPSVLQEAIYHNHFWVQTIWTRQNSKSTNYNFCTDVETSFCKRFVPFLLCFLCFFLLQNKNVHRTRLYNGNYWAEINNWTIFHPDAHASHAQAISRDKKQQQTRMLFTHYANETTNNDAFNNLIYHWCF